MKENIKSSVNIYIHWVKELKLGPTLKDLCLNANRIEKEDYTKFYRKLCCKVVVVDVWFWAIRCLLPSPPCSCSINDVYNVNWYDQKTKTLIGVKTDSVTTGTYLWHACQSQSSLPLVGLKSAVPLLKTTLENLSSVLRCARLATNSKYILYFILWGKAADTVIQRQWLALWNHKSR